MHWLPLARRTQLIPPLDLKAVRLALAAIDADGQPRAVHLAPASLTDGPFVAQLREALARAPRAAAGMWLEVPEDGVRDQHELLRAFAAMVRPLGVRFGLEHAGQAMHRAPRLYEVGLDYVKLDSALLRGVAHDEAVRSFVRGSMARLRSLPVLVFAQGIDDEADERALWDCGIDAITDPWRAPECVTQVERGKSCGPLTRTAKPRSQVVGSVTTTPWRGGGGDAGRIPSSAAARRSGHRSSEVDFGLNAAGPQ